MASVSVPSDIYSAYGAPLRVIDVSIDHKEAIYKCPYCINVKGTPDKSGHLYVNIKTRKFSCKRCGTEGRISNSNSNYSQEKDQSVEDIINMIKSIGGDDSELTSTQYTIPLCKVTSMKSAYEYMRNRGFTDEDIDYYDVRVGGIFNKNLFGRIVVPNVVYDRVYTDMYVARTYIDSGKRYMNPFGRNSSLAVFNLHRIPDNPDRLIICEGTITAMAAGHDAVALYGKHCSKTQLRKILAKNAKEIVVNLDPDAMSESDELCKSLYDLSPDTVIKQLVLPSTFDAADYRSMGIHYAYREMVENAQVYTPLTKKLL